MKRSKNYWNYRVVTKVIPGMQGIDLADPRNNKAFPDERVFSVVEVYYTIDDKPKSDRNHWKPDSYVESKNILGDLDSVESIKWTLKKIKKTLKREVLDLDKWPQIWKVPYNNLDEDGTNTFKWNVK